MEQVKLFCALGEWSEMAEMKEVMLDLENEINEWLKSRDDGIEIIRILNSSHYDETASMSVVTYSLFYKEKPKTKTEAPPEIRINKNAY